MQLGKLKFFIKIKKFLKEIVYTSYLPKKPNKILSKFLANLGIRFFFNFLTFRTWWLRTTKRLRIRIMITKTNCAVYVNVQRVHDDMRAKFVGVGSCSGDYCVWAQYIYYILVQYCKINIFWKGHKILQYIHRRFDWHYILRSNLRLRFRKIMWPPQNIWTLRPSTPYF